MIHFCFGLFFIIISILVLSAYCIALFALALLTGWLWKTFRYSRCSPHWRQYIEWPFKRSHLRPVFFVMVAITAFHLFMYVSERHKWIGKDNAHHAAKEYFAAGQPLYGVRLMLSRLFHPENRLFASLHALQQYIYDRGIQYLPENDAEKAIWLNSWFLYPYTYSMQDPKGTDHRKLSPPMIALLDKIWYCLEAQATLPMADREMASALYLKTYPVLANYYTMSKGYYNGVFDSSIRPFSRNEQHAQRSRLLVAWLEQLKQKWEVDPEMQSFLRQHPAPSALRNWVLISELMGLIQGDIWRGEFGCDTYHVQLYIQTRNRFIENKEYLRTTSSQNSTFFYEQVVNRMRSRATKYILQHYCNAVINGKEDNSFWYNKSKRMGVPPESLAEKRSKSLYDQEIEILEREKRNVRN